MIYEINRLEQELASLGRELAWSHRLATLGTLAATAAHEVNNLLTPISSYAQLALANPNDPRLVRRALEIAANNTQRASRMFAATLGYARDERGHGGPEPSQPNEMLEQALACLPREPEKDGIALQTSLEPANLPIHPTELQQVLLNLLLNARKALLQANSPKPRIEVEGRCEAEAEQYRLTVRDNGPGIREDIKHHLFEPFVTQPSHAGDAALSHVPPDEHDAEQVRGTGLGLAVCRRLIESAGGRIGVESEPGRGAAFIIVLPIEAA
ncbi:MAG: HAMP domain-containing sensor histidine kinase [Planctomycetota bacterium]